MEEIEKELLRDPTATLGLGGSNSTPKQQVQKAPQVQEQEEEEDSDFLDTIGDVALAPFRGIEGMLNGAYNLADMIAFDVLPDWDTRFLGTSKTTAGSLVEGVAQFASGFAPIFGAAGKIGALAKAGKVTQAITAEVVTDFVAFNGQEARLSNLIQQFPELQNPVTEFLAHDANESEVEGRLKNVLEGLILGGAIGGTVALFMKSIRALKEGKKARDIDGKSPDEVNQIVANKAPTADEFKLSQVTEDDSLLARQQGQKEFEEDFREVGGDPEESFEIDLTQDYSAIDLEKLGAVRLTKEEAETIEAGGQLISETNVSGNIVKKYELPNGSTRTLISDPKNPELILDANRLKTEYQGKVPKYNQDIESFDFKSSYPKTREILNTAGFKEDPKAEIPLVNVLTTLVNESKKIFEEGRLTYEGKNIKHKSDEDVYKLTKSLLHLVATDNFAKNAKYRKPSHPDSIVNKEEETAGQFYVEDRAATPYPVIEVKPDISSGFEVGGTYYNPKTLPLEQQKIFKESEEQFKDFPNLPYVIPSIPKTIIHEAWHALSEGAFLNVRDHLVLMPERKARFATALASKGGKIRDLAPEKLQKLIKEGLVRDDFPSAKQYQATKNLKALELFSYQKLLDLSKTNLYQQSYIDVNLTYGFSSIRSQLPLEFISESGSNPAFMKFLQSIKLDESDLKKLETIGFQDIANSGADNLFQVFINAIKYALGLKKGELDGTVLEKTLLSMQEVRESSKSFKEYKVGRKVEKDIQEREQRFEEKEKILERITRLENAEWASEKYKRREINKSKEQLRRDFAPVATRADLDAELGKIGPELKKDFYNKTLVEGVSTRMQTGKPMTAREAIQDLSDRTNGNLGQYSPIVKKLLALGKDTGIDAKLEERSFASDVPTGLKRGSFYESGKRRIVLDGQSSSVKENPIYNLLHESTHAVTVDNVNKYYDSTTFKNIDVNDITARAKAIDKVLSNKSLPKPVAEMFRMFKKADAMRDEIASKGELVGTDGKPDLYWIKNPAEFMSMAFSDPQLQQALKGIQYTPKMTMWEKVVNTVKSFFGRGVSKDLADNIVSRVGEIAEMKLPSQRGRGVDMMPGGEVSDLDKFYYGERAKYSNVLGLDQERRVYRHDYIVDVEGKDITLKELEQRIKNAISEEAYEEADKLQPYLNRANQKINKHLQKYAKEEGYDLETVGLKDADLSTVDLKPKLQEFDFAPEGRSKIETDPEWQQWADSVLKGESPTLPRLEVVGDIASAHKILTEKYKKNPKLLKKFDKAPIDFLDEDLKQIFEMGIQSIKDRRKIGVENEIFKDLLKGSNERLMKAVKEFEDTESLQSEAALRNQLSEFVEIYDFYRQMGYEDAKNLAMRRQKKPISRKIGLEKSELQNTAIVREFLNNQAGGMSPKKAVKLIKEMYDPNNPEATIQKVLGIAKKAQGKSLLDMTTEYWINSILSGPRTQAVNFLGNALTQILGTAEMTVGAVLSGNMPLAKAALASWADWGMYSEALSAVGKTLITGREVLDVGSRTMETSRQAIGESIDFGDSKSIDRNAINTLGTVVNLPARGLLGGDELFKQIAFRRAARLKAGMEAINLGIADSKGIAKYVEDKLNKVVTVSGQVMSEEALIREATKQADKLGLIGQQFAKKRAAHIKKYVDDNFDEDASNLAAYALEEAKYFTHTRELEEGTLGKGIQNLTKNFAFARFVLPFVRTPSNLLSFALERSPLGLPYRIPGTNKKLNVPGLRAEAEAMREGLKSSDPVVKAAARGKIVTAFAAAGLFYDMVFNNNSTFPIVTGGGPQNEKQKKILEETGWKPYSIKIGDTYYSYQRLDPIATLLGISADMSEMMKENQEANEEGLEQVGIAMATALARNVGNKSYLAGIQLWADAFKDPERFGERLGRNYSSSFVPNVLSQMQDYDKQSMREVRSIADAVLKKLPGGRDMLDPKRNILGEEKTIDYGTMGFINPIATTKEKDDEVLQEMAELQHAFTLPSSKELSGNIDLLDFVNNKGRTAYDRSLDLLQTVTIRGRTLRQTLKLLIKSSQYQRLPGYSAEVGFDSPRVQEINKVLRRFRQTAKKEMYKEFPELMSHKNKITRALQLNKQGVNNQDVLELLSQTN